MVAAVSTVDVAFANAIGDTKDVAENFMRTGAAAIGDMKAVAENFMRTVAAAISAAMTSVGVIFMAKTSAAVTLTATGATRVEVFMAAGVFVAENLMAVGNPMVVDAGKGPNRDI